jgi:hypothetical protein
MLENFHTLRCPMTTRITVRISHAVLITETINKMGHASHPLSIRSKLSSNRKWAINEVVVSDSFTSYFMILCSTMCHPVNCLEWKGALNL